MRIAPRDLSLGNRQTLGSVYLGCGVVMLLGLLLQLLGTGSSGWGPVRIVATVLQVVGCSGLVWLGARMLRASGR